MLARACVWVPERVGVCIGMLIKHATRVRHTVTLFVAPRSPLYFSTLFHKRCDFRKNVIEYKMCVFIFSTTFVQNISHSKKNLAKHRQKCRYVFM